VVNISTTTISGLAKVSPVYWKSGEKTVFTCPPSSSSPALFTCVCMCAYSSMTLLSHMAPPGWSRREIMTYKHTYRHSVTHITQFPPGFTLTSMLPLVQI
jgi:hypothetical protein